MIYLSIFLLIKTYLRSLKSGNCKICPSRFHLTVGLGKSLPTEASQSRIAGWFRETYTSLGSTKNWNLVNLGSSHPAMKKEGKLIKNQGSRQFSLYWNDRNQNQNTIPEKSTYSPIVPEKSSENNHINMQLKLFN